ncbi:hypothetical protein M9H77_22121 [Catharanthus roseus]|uniref:Uncharacterized protein n=1 Tax=Catharanthus roseus TaxID=4058 RepID=A0ACC0ATM2_CATRO|nr:hypothetical protein M9H77_22121 [Catharanthus roseus]
MGSGYFGELPNLGNDQRGSGGSSSRKSKKNNSDKPKQPQRGLGVAQLEKIRLHSQMEDMRLQTGYSSSSSSFSSYSTPSSTSYGAFPGQQNIVMGLSDIERVNMRYGDSQPPPNSTRWPPGNAFLDGQQFTQPNMTRQLLDLQAEDSFEKRRRKNGSGSFGSSTSQNSESSGGGGGGGHQDLDLELRLSL